MLWSHHCSGVVLPLLSFYHLSLLWQNLVIPEQGWRVQKAEQGKFRDKRKDNSNSQYLEDIEKNLINLVTADKVESANADSCLHATSRKDMIREYQIAIVPDGEAV